MSCWQTLNGVFSAELTQTHVRQLDAFTHVYMKRWAGVPPSTTNLVFHMKVGMDIPSIETLYHTCHSLNHAAMRLKGDLTVNAAIDNCISRESEWTHKKSTVVASEAVFTYVQDEVSLMPVDSESNERAKKTHAFKALVKKKVFSDSLEKQKIHLETLLKQGDYLKFAEQEKCDPNWKSVVYNLPKGTMKFLLNSFTNTLPTGDNLKL